MLDAGKDNYAGVSFSDIPEKDGRRIYLGWMSNWRYANDVPTYGWRSQMTLPRVLQLHQDQDGYTIIQTPVEELDFYLTKAQTLSDVIISDESPIQMKLDEPYFIMDFVIENVDAASYQLILQHTANQFTSIHIDMGKGELSLDRSTSGKVDFSENFSHVQTVKIDRTDVLKLYAVADSSSIELFINDGKYALTSLVYPYKISSEITLSSSGGKVKIADGTILIPAK
ncbi:GH32 C-terminal domain-containing protein (plasmid) [Pseudalkalibacillus hwajinpoensis]|uniref:glycoside hydrolase family 32 protein n=1 Tax=Guptibacillus hwajinpoensis TaxID=208199 RepID=UPI00325C20C2